MGVIEIKGFIFWEASWKSIDFAASCGQVKMFSSVGIRRNKTKRWHSSSMGSLNQISWKSCERMISLWCHNFNIHKPLTSWCIVRIIADSDYFIILVLFSSEYQLYPFIAAKCWFVHSVSDGRRGGIASWEKVMTSTEDGSCSDPQCWSSCDYGLMAVLDESSEVHQDHDWSSSWDHEYPQNISEKRGQ